MTSHDAADVLHVNDVEQVADDAPKAEPVYGSGRVRHDDKITVYLSSEELLRLEQARLTLRSDHGLSVDRGRVVREAIAASLDDLEARGGDSEIVRRLASGR